MTVPIRDIRAGGYRVLADNPETPGQAPADYGDFERESWRVLQLQINKPDGGWLKVSLARPLWWIKATPTNPDGLIWLEFEELGIANWAEVLSINECPEDILGDGRLVTGTFQHSAANAIELTFSHSEEAIRSTANHPFWSEDRQEFVQAGELTTGEHVRLLDGSTSSLTRAVPLEEEFPVFNLEVDGEHVYYVGNSGVLVHNAAHYGHRKNGQFRAKPGPKTKGLNRPYLRVATRKKILAKADKDKFGRYLDANESSGAIHPDACFCNEKNIEMLDSLGGFWSNFQHRQRLKRTPKLHPTRCTP